jgi:16S rRNA (guanine527-N7)-methyltransferase
MDPQVFQKMLEEKGVSLTSEQLQQFERYFQLLVEWNEKMNLTGITEKNQVYEKHFYDSITPAFYFDFLSAKTLIDVGSGAGFPGIPLKICFPHIQLTILDSLKKRLTFLQEVINELRLEQVTLVHSRAEDAGQNAIYREKFDLVTARAVARLSVLSEFCLPFTKVGGTFLVMKGAQSEEELNEGKKGIHVLGGKIKNMHTFSLPIEKAERNIIEIRKEKKTPKIYPRKAGIPAKNPIS